MKINLQFNLVVLFSFLCIATGTSNLSWAAGRKNCESSLKPKVFQLDLRPADGYAVTDFDLLKKTLKKLKLDPDKILLRGFDGSELDQILENGTEQNSENPIHRFITWKDVEETEEDGGVSIFKWADKYRNPAIAIYDLSQLEDLQVEYYKFISPDNKKAALLAIIILSY